MMARNSVCVRDRFGANVDNNPFSLFILRLQWSNALCTSPASGGDQEFSSGVLMELIVPNNHGGGSLSMEVCRYTLCVLILTLGRGRGIPNRIQKHAKLLYFSIKCH